MKKLFSFKKNKKRTLAAQRKEHKRVETDVLASFDDVFKTVDLSEKLAKLGEIEKAIVAAQETDLTAAKKEKQRVGVWWTVDICLGSAFAAAAAVPTGGASVAFVAAALCSGGVRGRKLGKYNNEAGRHSDSLESFKNSAAALAADIQDTLRRDAETGTARYVPRHAL